jgi:putative membrane protein insertion efficiency factor
LFHNRELKALQYVPILLEDFPAKMRPVCVKSVLSLIIKHHALNSWSAPRPRAIISGTFALKYSLKPFLKPLQCSACTEAMQRIPRHAGRAMIGAYRYTLSPLIGFHCRHLPTCSSYGDEAIGRFGLWAGGWMTLARLLRCQPFGTSGIDNVPVNAPHTARWYLPWRYGRWRGVNSQHQ